MIRPKTILVAIAVIAVASIGIWALKSGGPGDVARNEGRPATKAASQSRSSGDALSSAFTKMSAGGTSDETRASLLDLKNSLAGMPKDEALAVIRGFLASGKDHPTGLSFEIAKDGSLTEWPTFRAFLLDTLAAIDPAAAAAIGREILASPTSADEWALEVEKRVCAVPVGMHGWRIDRALAQLIPEFSRSYLQQLMADGAVVMREQTLRKPAARIAAGHGHSGIAAKRPEAAGDRGADVPVLRP